MRVFAHVTSFIEDTGEQSDRKRNTIAATVLLCSLTAGESCRLRCRRSVRTLGPSALSAGQRCILTQGINEWKEQNGTRIHTHTHTHSSCGSCLFDQVVFHFVKVLFGKKKKKILCIYQRSHDKWLNQIAFDFWLQPESFFFSISISRSPSSLICLCKPLVNGGHGVLTLPFRDNLTDESDWWWDTWTIGSH